MTKSGRLILVGQSLIMPVFFEMNLVTGQIEYFGYIDFMDPEAEHNFVAFGGIYLDEKDP